MAGVGSIFLDVVGSAQTSCLQIILQGRQGQSNDFLACIDDPLDVLPVCRGAVHIPNCSAVCQCSQHSSGKALSSSGASLFFLSVLTVEPLLGLFNQGSSVGCPCEILTEVSPQKLKAGDPLYLFSTNN